VPNADKIDALIATVRDLNHTLRPKISNVPGGGDGVSQQVHSILGQMREGELEAALRIQAMLVGEQAAADEKYRLPLDVIGTRSLLSEFGTAREAILASLRELPEAQWEEVHETALGSASVSAVVDNLIASDQTAVAQLKQLTAS
jgi:hypothetical protein